MTAPPDQRNVQAANLLTMRIIASALMVGLTTFGAVVAFLRLDQEPGEWFLTYFAIAVTAADLVAWVVAPGFIAAQAVRQLSNDATDAEWMGVYQTRMIIGLALLEGVGFLNLMAYYLNGHWWSLAVAGGLLLLMILSFPTQFKVDTWIEDQKQKQSLR